MDINWYIITSIMMRAVSIALLLVYVIPKQIKEVRNNRNEYSSLAALLLSMVVVFVTLALAPLSYQTTRIYSPNEFTFQNIASVLANIGVLALSVGWYLVYNYKFKKRK